MQCTFCQSKILGTHCPVCGSKQVNSEDSPQRSGGTKLGVKKLSNPAVDVETGTSDWRLQIKRKVSERTGRSLASSRNPHQSGKSDEISYEDSVVDRPLFDYKLSESAEKPRKPKVVRLTKRENTFTKVAEKPLIRASLSSPSTVRSKRPQQQAFTLNAPLAPLVVSPDADEVGDYTEVGVSPEVIFSRLLAGMIDLALPFLIAFVFTLSASFILDSELIASSSLHLGLLLSCCFFFFNSFFFLILSGQTPGMYLTDLQLVGENTKEVPFLSLVLRILLLLPVVATMVGLLWGVADPWCRCVHDRISKTRIVPIAIQSHRR